MVLIDAGSTLTADDLQTIRALQETAVPVNVLLSKADLLAAEDRVRIIQYVKDHIASECRLNLPVRPVSVLSSCREMTDRWFQEEIVPLYGRSQQFRAASLRRKTALSRNPSCGAASADARRQQSSTHSKEQIRAAESLLRTTTGQIEEMRSLCEREIEGRG